MAVFLEIYCTAVLKFPDFYWKLSKVAGSFQLLGLKSLWIDITSYSLLIIVRLGLWIAYCIVLRWECGLDPKIQLARALIWAKIDTLIKISIDRLHSLGWSGLCRFYKYIISSQYSQSNCSWSIFYQSSLIIHLFDLLPFWCFLLTFNDLEFWIPEETLFIRSQFFSQPPNDRLHIIAYDAFSWIISNAFIWVDYRSDLCFPATALNVNPQ